MEIKIAGCADLGVAEIVGDNDQRRANCDHKACIDMPERVDVDIWKIVALHEFMEPLRDRVRKHRLPIIPCKDAVIPHQRTPLILPLLILQQDKDGRPGDTKRTLAAAVFRPCQ